MDLKTPGMNDIQATQAIREHLLRPRSSTGTQHQIGNGSHVEQLPDQAYYLLAYSVCC